MAQINWTDEANRWLRDVHDYIAADDPQAAMRVVHGIYDKVQLLKCFPELGHRYTALPDQNVRILLYGHYQIPYLVKGDGGIDVLGVFHAGLDVDRYLI